MAQIDVMDLLAPVGQICRGCPSPTLIKAYVDAARQFCSKTRWLITTAPGVCTIGTAKYAIGNDPHNEVIGINAMTVLENASSTPKPVTQRHSSRWDRSEDDALPRYYAYIPEANFALHPTPNQAYVLSLSLVLQPKRGVTSIDAALATQWEYALRMGALAYLLSLPDVGWTNPREAVRQENLFIDKMNQAISSVGRGYNAGVQDTGVNEPRDSRPRSSVLAI